jgi:hypothetical protein
MSRESTSLLSHLTLALCGGSSFSVSPADFVRLHQRRLLDLISTNRQLTNTYKIVVNGNG